MSSYLLNKSKTPLQFKMFHSLLGLVVFFALITVPAENAWINFFGLTVSSDVLWWPVVFYILYLIYRVYGFSYFRHCVYLIIIYRLVYLLFLKLAIYLPGANFWALQIPYSQLLGRNFLYMFESSCVFWLCTLYPFGLSSKPNFQKPKLIFFVSLFFFYLLNIPITGENFGWNIVLILVIFSILMIFSDLILNFFFKLERPTAKNNDYKLFKFYPNFQLSNEQKIFKYHHILFCSSVVFFIASKTMAAKFISIGIFTINVGGIVFSLAYLASDIMTDVYGIERTKQMIYFVIFANLLFVFDVWLTNSLSIQPNGLFKQILHNQPRMFLSSGVAFFLGMHVNSLVISIIKTRQKNKGISLKKEFITTVWARIATSTSFAIILDVSLFSLVAFYGLVPKEKLMHIIFFEDAYKISYEVLLAPFSVLLIYALKVKEQVDFYDTITNFNPFRINTDYKFDANKFFENCAVRTNKDEE